MGILEQIDKVEADFDSTALASAVSAGTAKVCSCGRVVPTIDGCVFTCMCGNQFVSVPYTVPEK